MISTLIAGLPLDMGGLGVQYVDIYYGLEGDRVVLHKAVARLNHQSLVITELLSEWARDDLVNQIKEARA